MQPALTNRLIQEAAQLGIAKGHPAAGGDAIGDIGEFLRPQGRKFRHQAAFNQVAMQARHPIHMVGTHRGQVGHAHGLLTILFND